MISKSQKVDLIEVLENGCVQVRTKISIFEDNKQLNATFERHVIAPGADYSNEDVKVQAIAAVVHTSEVIAAYIASQSEQIPA